jgi:hypothetical protein
MQIQMSFVEEKIPIRKTAVWDQLDDEHKAIVIESIARFMAKMILADNNQEPKNDR